ncbi:alpha/beta hydrolase [Mycobacterium sp.]|uniref:alpha/beta hydrolase n=1 Tax=Mycobacterium sp. TaxID=1785 RepID=UPI002D932617|nr:alpha/beta hydrolase [Mycobacterium sp.]
MIDRFLVWLGAVVVAAGMSAATFAGAALAVADDGSTSGAGGATSSESSNSAGSNEDSANDGPSDNEPTTNDDADDEPQTESPATAPDADEEATDEEGTEEETTEEEGAEDVSPGSDSEQTAADAKAESDTAETLQPSTETVNAKPADAPDKPLTTVTEPAEEAVVDEPAETSSEPATAEPVVVVVQDDAADIPEAAVTEMAFAATSNALAPTAAAPQAPSLINVIGTLIFNLYSFATRVFGGPPVLPPGSTVTVRQSTLHIDCGDGYDVPADWYIPATGAEPPTRMIYLQHGFLAAGPWYSYTAAALAEQTNSIVVAPSITSNFFACDACWLGAAPMQEAVADLFLDSNTALADSALAAGYTGALPDRVVLVGHSLGGGLVAATAGYMVDNNTIDRLAGVVMLDGVGMNNAVPTGLAKIPDSLLIYQLAAPSYFWNQFGAASEALVQERPDRFVGVVLEGGSHVDAMQGGNPLIQFGQELVAGFTQPQNVAAAKILMVGWINDMFAGTQDEGIYAQPGDVFTINTPAGQATAQALPSSLTKPFLLNVLQPFVTAVMGFFTFEPTCVAESMATARCTGSMAA